MDFSRLLSPYCSTKQQKAFQNALLKKAVSSFIVNRRTKEIPMDFFPNRSILKDPLDPLVYRFDKETLPLGKSLLHFAGAFYIMDASSSIISYYLAPLLSEAPLVIDLCSAPGGKTIALNERKPQGYYLSNDMSFVREDEARKNFERLGMDNVMSISMDPLKLSFPPMFDAVLLDAPCSGSGMIRKEKKMIADWSSEKVNRLLPVQSSLLEKAATLLKKGGILCYSTCSFSIEEDENQVEGFLLRHPEMEEVKVNVSEDIVPGKEGYHLIPGIYEGEGMYFCFLRKKEGTSYLPKEITSGLKKDDSGDVLYPVGKNIYVTTRMFQEYKRLKPLAVGLKDNDTSPHPKCPYDHAYSRVSKAYRIALSKEEALAYARGEEVRTEKTEEGLVVLTYRDYPLGFGKNVKGRIKNYLPKGLRADLVL